MVTKSIKQEDLETLCQPTITAINYHHLAFEKTLNLQAHMDYVQRI